MRKSLLCVDTMVLLGALSLGCSPKDVPPPEEPVPTVMPSEPTAGSAIGPGFAATDEREPQPEPAPAPKEPEFTEGMTVQQAIDAAQGTDRIEIEQEVLAEPIVNPELYAPCKLKGNQRFTLRVAIWEGRVVGMDLSLTPKNDAAEQCIRSQVQGVTWKKKVKSLSTFEFNY